MFNFGMSTHLIGILAKLGPAFMEVRQRASELAAVGALPTKDELAELLHEKWKNFDPRIGQDILIGEEERNELTRGFAGLARRLVIAEQK
jgi:hypothetical protein